VIDRLRLLLNRPVRELPTGLALAACGLMIVLGALLLSQIADPEQPRPPEPRAQDADAGGYSVTNPPVVSHETHPSELPSEEGPSRARVTPHDARDVRASTHAFMRGYLAYTYGRARAIEITNATRELIAQLEQSPPRVPEDVRKRRPRVELVHSDGIGEQRAAAVAIVTDGVTRYSVGLRLVRTGMEEWSVTDVGPA